MNTRRAACLLAIVFLPAGCGSRSSLLDTDRRPPGSKTEAPGAGGQKNSSGSGARNGQDDDVMSPAPSFVSRVEVGALHSCALLTSGGVRCWGDVARGRLGYGAGTSLGATPRERGDVPLGAPAVDLAVGSQHSCALLDTGAVRCWGSGPGVGYPGVDIVGDDETPADLGDVDLDRRAIGVAAGTDLTCAILEDGAVRCWGAYPQLSPATTDDVALGASARLVSCGNLHCCALLDTEAVRCWGAAQFGSAVGYPRWPGGTPAERGDVDVGGPVVHLAAGGDHTCALLRGGQVRCWGDATSGALGYTNDEDIGDDETPAAAGDVDVGGPAVYLVGGKRYSCAILETGALRCWGDGSSGTLGYGNPNDIGDDETPAAAGDVPLGERVLHADANTHTCALLASGTVKCWGPNIRERLGFPGDFAIGDDEPAGSAPAVPILEP